jgi:acetyltransferase-like isoleucine patch superfamily enzyme
VADDIVIGAGAVVRENLDAPGIYAGVPARRVR